MKILKNEKYCGDALCQKTVTTDFLTHKSVKNNGLEPQYFIEDHHPAIIMKDDGVMAQQIRTERRNVKRRKRRRKPRYVVKGYLAGFMIVDPQWTAEDVDNIFLQLDENDENSSADINAEEHFFIEQE